MRNPGDILLVSCYELGHQPFHLASLLAMLRQAGYQPASVDTSVETLTDETIQHAHFVGISVPMHTALRLGEQIAQRIRKINPSAHICLYGLYALLNADYLLRDLIDSAIAGEYETPLLNLVAALDTNSNSSVPGVHTRSHVSGPWIERTPFLVPDRQSLPSPNRYARLQIGDEMRLAGYTESTRGCKHTCLHCPLTPIYNGRFFAVPVTTVLADIRSQVTQGVRHITFGDPDFWNGPTHALRVVRAMHQEFPNVTFDATIKVEHLLKHRHHLLEMRELGCVFVVSAVESINDNVLLHLDKGHTAADVVEVFDLMQHVGIPLRPSLLPFSPWETLESYTTLLNFFEEHHLIEHIDPVHLSIRLLIPPGSALLDTPDSHTWLGELDSSAYTYQWSHPDSRMDDLQRHIAQQVEQGESLQTNPVETFLHVKELVSAMQGHERSLREALDNYGTPKVLPHLTESWFC